MKLSLQKYCIVTLSWGSWMAEDNDGLYYFVEDVENLLKEIGYLIDFNLKNDSYRHDMVFKGVNITYRLSVTKSHFWIYNKDTGQEIQYINNDNGIITPWNKWESFMEDFWLEILKDMR